MLSAEVRRGVRSGEGVLNRADVLACEFQVRHAVNMNRYFAPVRDLEELTLEQRRFLGRVAARIPRLIEAVQAGPRRQVSNSGPGVWMTGGILNSNWSRGYLKASGMGSPDLGGRYRRDSRRTKGRSRSTPVGRAVEPKRSDVEQCLHRRASSCAAIWGGDTRVGAHRAGATGGRKRVYRDNSDRV